MNAIIFAIVVVIEEIISVNSVGTEMRCDARWEEMSNGLFKYASCFFFNSILWKYRHFAVIFLATIDDILKHSGREISAFVNVFVWANERTIWQILIDHRYIATAHTPTHSFAKVIQQFIEWTLSIHMIFFCLSLSVLKTNMNYDIEFAPCMLTIYGWNNEHTISASQFIYIVPSW